MGAIQEDHDHEGVVDLPVDSAKVGELKLDPAADEAADATQDVEVEPEPSDHGIDKYPLVGSQYTLEGRNIHLRCMNSTLMMVMVNE
jgi:hypothetical protein